MIIFVVSVCTITACCLLEYEFLAAHLVMLFIFCSLDNVEMNMLCLTPGWNPGKLKPGPHISNTGLNCFGWTPSYRTERCQIADLNTLRVDRMSNIWIKWNYVSAWNPLNRTM